MTHAANNAVCSGETTGSQLVLFCDKKYILSVTVIHRSNPVTRKNINVKLLQIQKYIFLQIQKIPIPESNDIFSGNCFFRILEKYT